MGRGLARTWGLMLAIAGACLATGNAVGETLMLPYSCSKIGNRIITAPSPPRRYAVAGAREALTLSMCPTAPDRADCPRIVVHHFDIMCGSKRVPWSEVALSIADGWLGDARPGRAAGTVGRCALSSARASQGDPAGPGLSLLCNRGPGSFHATRLLVPDGYAPLAETGARFEGGPARIVASQRPNVVPAIVTSSPLPDITPSSDAVADERLDFAQALAASRQAEPVAAADQAGLPGWIVLLCASGLAGGGWWVAVRRWPREAKIAKAKAARLALRGIETTEILVARVQQSIAKSPLPFFAPVIKSKPITDIKAANAASAVAALLSDAEGRLADLKNAGPLNDVLRHELSQLRQRLTALQATAAESEDAAAKASPGFRNLLRDIERVRRIADSAALSIGPGRNATRIPATKAEAFDLLGLNPDVAEGTLKKVADGLRMNWHPDHARDDEDRAAREARIKAINIALDLINGKRVAA